MKRFVIHLLVVVFIVTWCSPWLSVSPERIWAAHFEENPMPDTDNTTPEWLEEMDDDELAREAPAGMAYLPAGRPYTGETRHALVFKNHVREVAGPPPRVTVGNRLG